MYRAFFLTAWLIAAPLLMACCPADPDTLEKEAASMPGILDLIAGKIPRLPAKHYLNEHTAALKDIEAAPDKLDGYLRGAEALDMLGRPLEGAGLLEKCPEHKLAPADRQRRDMMLTRLYLHQWFTDLDPAPSSIEGAMRHAERAALDPLMVKLLAWAQKTPPFNDKELLPDFFGLRLAPNKTALSDNTQLAEMGLNGVPAFLETLLRLNPVWENVDTYYALSLALGVLGKQHLAYFARLRVFELLDAGKTSRVALPSGVTDVKPMLSTRHFSANALIEIPTLSADAKKMAEAQFSVRRRDAQRWLTAREEFGAKRIAEGKAPTDEGAFWQGFSYQALDSSAPTAAAAQRANAPADNSPDAGSSGVSVTTIIAAAVAACAVAVVVFASRRRRKPPAQEA